VESPQEIRESSERATLMLARTRALSDLQHACAPAHRAMLEQAIADLDRRLKALEISPPERAGGARRRALD